MLFVEIEWGLVTAAIMVSLEAGTFHAASVLPLILGGITALVYLAGIRRWMASLNVAASRNIRLIRLGALLLYPYLFAAAVVSSFPLVLDLSILDWHPGLGLLRIAAAGVVVLSLAMLAVLHIWRRELGGHELKVA
jgi:hypothetical protein